MMKADLLSRFLLIAILGLGLTACAKPREEGSFSVSKADIMSMYGRDGVMTKTDSGLINAVPFDKNPKVFMAYYSDEMGTYNHTNNGSYADLAKAVEAASQCELASEVPRNVFNLNGVWSYIYPTSC